MNYRKKYINTYIWQIFSIILGFVSLFIVTPFISSNKIMYGIYSLCTSLTVFFSYADLGLLSSASKYCAEYYIKGDQNNESKILGFSAFIMLLTFSIIAISLFVLSYNPLLVIPELTEESSEFYFARNLLLIMAISCPLIIAQRILQIVFSVRVEDYKYQRLIIVGNMIRILSAFYFFGCGEYKIFEYYIFYQFVQLLIVVVGSVYIRKYGYSIKELAKSFRYDKEIFDKVKGLSGASLISMICTILLFEFDQIVISNFIGIEAVAIYAIAISCFSFVRSFNSITYAPYTSRFYHFTGLDDIEGLVAFTNKLIVFLGPLFVVPIMTISFYSEPFVISWVGEAYQESAKLLSLLVICFSVNFLRTPLSQFYMATERITIMIKNSIMEPMIYWIGIFVFVDNWGLMAFAFFKALAPCVVAFYLWFVVKKDIRIMGYSFVKAKEVIISVFLPVAFLYVLSMFLKDFTVCEHSKLFLFRNLVIMLLSIALSVLFAIPFNPYLKVEAVKLKNKFIRKRI